jgi:hypothetical protein
MNRTPITVTGTQPDGQVRVFTAIVRSATTIRIGPSLLRLGAMMSRNAYWLLKRSIVTRIAAFAKSPAAFRRRA